jgi:hypothetical protein
MVSEDEAVITFGGNGVNTIDLEGDVKLQPFLKSVTE